VGKRFDEAWREALAIAHAVADEGVDVVLIRDLLGRAALLIADSDDRPYPVQRREPIERQLSVRCAPYVGEQPVLAATDMFAPEVLLLGPDLMVLQEADPATGHGRLAVLERGVVGREWPHVGTSPRQNRVTLYGFKGGVGRSTAAALLARQLAARGNCVLLVDLDLESPGVSAVGLDASELPDHGLVDVLVESLVGNPTGLECVARSGRLQFEGNGEIWVAPAGGRPRNGYSYLPKLNRAYLDSPDSSALVGDDARVPSMRSFAARLQAAVEYCTDEVDRMSRKPDVVLLDSRAGIHDIAAVAITQLSDLTLLFGVDNGPTWVGYHELFRQWQADGGLARAIRERLRMVAAMMPAASAGEYLARFRDRAHALFEPLYDDEMDGGDAEAFNPAVADIDAPHSPLPILFSTDLVGVDVTGTIGWLDQEFVSAAFGEFVRSAADLIVGDPGGCR
jgi:hypothetical protein